MHALQDSAKIAIQETVYEFRNKQSTYDKHLSGYMADNHRTSVMREFSASRHFFKTNVTQSVAELILYSQKTQNCGHFLSNLMN